MSKVLVTKEKLDTVASIVCGKSNTPVPETIDDVIEAADKIETPKKQSKKVSPKTAKQVITYDPPYNGLEDVTIQPIKPVNTSDSVVVSGPDINIPYGWYGTDVNRQVSVMTLPTSTTTTKPSGTTKATISRNSLTRYLRIPAGYNRSLEYYTIVGVPDASAQVWATKGTVYNHSVSITPNYKGVTAGYIGTGTVSGTDVTVSASELVSGDKSITQNGTNIDVTNYETVSVAVPSPFELTYSYDSVNDVFTFDKTYAEIKAAIQDDEQIIYISSSEQVLGDIYDDGYYTNKTVTGTTFSECVALLLQANIGSRDRVVVLYYGLVSGVLTQKWVKSYVKPYDAKSISSNGNYIDVNDYSAVHVSVPNSYSAGDEGKVVSSGALVSQTSDTVTANDTYDTTLINSLTVNVSGGSSSPTVATSTTTLSAAASSIQFTGLSGNPTSFVITSSADQSTGGTKAVAVAYDGTNLFGMNVTTQAVNDTGFSKSYSSGTLTVTATSATFEANEYKLVYTYGGNSSDIHTADVQVGSGATSITFSSLSGKPAYFSCVFKSSFGTSSGYQRVIDVVNDGTNTYGHAFDSSAKAQTSWSYSYSGGSLTISSTGTNNGGYFHQPGYYQLTYAVDPNALNLQQKTGIGASTSSQTITADNGYDGLESVQIDPVSQTNLTAGNIKSGTTISISNGSTNLWSVTGTYSGGGSSMNVQTHQSTSRTTSTSLSSVNSLTCSTTGTYDVYWTCTRSSTSGTWSSRLYIAGTASGDEQTTWTNHVQTVKLTGVSINADQTVAVYAKSRGSNYYAYAPQLTIVQTS